MQILSLPTVDTVVAPVQDAVIDGAVASFQNENGKNAARFRVTARSNIIFIKAFKILPL